MASATKLQRNWDNLKPKLRERWKELNSDDLHKFDGDNNALIDLIQRKTGEARESIEQFINEAAGGGAILTKAKEAAVHYGKEAISGVQEAAGQAAESASRRLHDTESLVKRSPIEAAAVCMGAGMVCGILLGIALRRR